MKAISGLNKNLRHSLMPKFVSTPVCIDANSVYRTEFFVYRCRVYSLS